MKSAFPRLCGSMRAAAAWLVLSAMLAGLSRGAVAAAFRGARGQGRASMRKASGVVTADTTPVKSVVICGPSGAGKGTLIAKLLESFPNSFALSVSHTSRAPRPGEINGFHYHFSSLELIAQDIQSGPIPFIEHANVHGNLYGTRQDAVEKIHKQGKVCILDVDVHGVKQIKSKHFPAKFVFIRPPSIADLEKRLRHRNTETEAAIAKRLGNAQTEIDYGDGRDEEGKPQFDKVVINGDLEEAWKELTATVKEWFPSYFK